MLGRISKDLTLPTITCSKLTMEILEQGVKYVQTIKTPERRHWHLGNLRKPEGTSWEQKAAGVTVKWGTIRESRRRIYGIA